MMKIWISRQKVDILKLHFFVSLPFKKSISNKFFWQKKINGRGPWEKIILSDHGNPLMGSLRSSSVSPKYGLQRLNLTVYRLALVA